MTAKPLGSLTWSAEPFEPRLVENLIKISVLFYWLNKLAFVYLDISFVD